jgi:hypothetical protein
MKYSWYEHVSDVTTIELVDSFCGLFYDAVSISDYVAPNYTIIGQ